MNLVICMAGKNTRFHDVGFDIPKYLLPWGGTNVITHILSNFDNIKETILVANNRDIYFKKLLLKTVSTLGLTANNLIYIDDTNGQATTAKQGVHSLKDQNEPLLIHNADTILMGRDFQFIEDSLKNSADLYVDVFHSESDFYSYINFQNGNRVISIDEKVRNSNFASSGLYGFRNSKCYLDLYKRTSTVNEFYISNVVQTAINMDFEVICNEIQDMQSTEVLGTPAEYGLSVARHILGEV